MSAISKALKSGVRVGKAPFDDCDDEGLMLSKKNVCDSITGITHSSEIF